MQYYSSLTCAVVTCRSGSAIYLTHSYPYTNDYLPLTHLPDLQALFYKIIYIELLKNGRFLESPQNVFFKNYFISGKILYYDSYWPIFKLIKIITLETFNKEVFCCYLLCTSIKRITWTCSVVGPIIFLKNKQKINSRIFSIFVQ